MILPKDRILRDHAASVASYLAIEGGRWSLALPPDLQAIYTKSYGGYALAVLSDDGRVIYSSLPNDRPFSVAQPHNTQLAFFHENRGTSIYYGMILPVSRQGHTAWIQVEPIWKIPMSSLTMSWRAVCRPHCLAMK